MNREQAEHILDAYVHMRICEFGPDASDALREVILDAMTEYKTQTVSTYPGITLPADGKPWVTFTGNDQLSTPKVTWTGHDPLYGTCTTGVGE